VPYEELVKRIDEYKGCWINSNMPDLRCNKELPRYKVIEVEGGGQKRKVGLLGLCTVDKNLYQAGAFGGAMATALPVYETAAELRKKLLEEEGCDLVIPMTHQVPRTAPLLCPLAAPHLMTREARAGHGRRPADGAAEAGLPAHSGRARP
jgi:hypothetical protein